MSDIGEAHDPTKDVGVALRSTAGAHCHLMVRIGILLIISFFKTINQTEQFKMTIIVACTVYKR